MEKVKRTPAKLHKMVEVFGFEIINKGSDYATREITIPDVNRPALQLVGFYDYFEPRRLQIFGKAEMTFLKAMDEAARREVFDAFLRCEIPALIISRNMEVFPELQELAEKHGRTLLRTPLQTVDVSSHVIDYLNRALAPQIVRHGVLMNIYGQGVLMLGDSGIGKSETAIELLKRGHRLVADDAVEIRQVSNQLFGTAPEIIRHYVEIRGVGIIEVQKLFGMGAVQFETEIDLVIQLEPWVDGKFYDRLGLGEDTYTMLGVSLPRARKHPQHGMDPARIVWGVMPSLYSYLLCYVGAPLQRLVKGKPGRVVALLAILLLWLPFFRTHPAVFLFLPPLFLLLLPSALRTERRNGSYSLQGLLLSLPAFVAIALFSLVVLSDSPRALLELALRAELKNSDFFYYFHNVVSEIRYLLIGLAVASVFVLLALLRRQLTYRRITRLVRIEKYTETVLLFLAFILAFIYFVPQFPGYATLPHPSLHF